MIDLHVTGKKILCCQMQPIGKALRDIFKKQLKKNYMHYSSCKILIMPFSYRISVQTLFVITSSSQHTKTFACLGISTLKLNNLKEAKF